MTPPLKSGENRNARRVQQISYLHKEFEDLKQKIRSVENKNEKILEKIHQAHNFKKKNLYLESSLGDPQSTHVIHYDNPHQSAPFVETQFADSQST